MNRRTILKGCIGLITSVMIGAQILSEQPERVLDDTLLKEYSLDYNGKIVQGDDTYIQLAFINKAGEIQTVGPKKILLSKEKRERIRRSEKRFHDSVSKYTGFIPKLM